MSVSVKPNILLILDASGSMNEFAYQEESGCRAYSSSCACDVQAWTGYHEGTEYYGLFDPDLCYTYSNSDHYFSAAGPVYDDPNTAEVERAAELQTGEGGGRGCFSGNWLNWLTTRRSDVAKKVLTGGKLFPGTTDVLMGTVGPGSTSLDRDQRKVFNDRLATPDLPGKSVYYTPLKEPVYVYFFAETIPGTSTYGVIFNLIESAPCATPYRVDTGSTGYLNQAAAFGGETSATCSWCDYEGFFLAAKTEELPSGIVQSLGNSRDASGNLVEDNEDDSTVRLGYMHYNYNDGGKLYNHVNDAGVDNAHFDSIVTAINDLRSEGWTPTDESVYEAIRYFKRNTSWYGSSSTEWGRDPYFFDTEGQTVPCSKSFIILITDGEPNYNEDIGSWADRAFVGDGWFNYDGQYSYYLDDLAFTTHTEDIRADLGGTQTLTLYTVFAFDNSERAKNYLKRASRVGGFKDLNGDGQPFSDEPGHSSVADGAWGEEFYTGSCGSRDAAGNCTADPLCKEWDRNCDGHPDTYFEAQNGQQMAEGLLKAITDILRRTASGTSLSILSTSAHGEGALYQAYFKPQEVSYLNDAVAETTWVGYLHGLWVDGMGRIREDNGDLKLVYADDPVIQFYFDEALGSRVKRDADGDGTFEQDDIPLSEVRSLWEAGKVLALRDPDGRDISSYLPGKGKVDFLPGTEDQADFQAALGTATEQETEELIRYIRGEDLPGSRARAAYLDSDGDSHNDTLGTWRLGDIIYSTPTVVSRPMENYDQLYGDETFRDYESRHRERPTTIYVGANDGMLHAFHAGLYVPGDDSGTGDVREHGRYEAGGTEIGTELWAYVPGAVLPNLSWLQDDGYQHAYYVDLKPKVTDARIFTPDDAHPHGWGTVLVGGLRLGGVTPDPTSPYNHFPPASCYFAFDITVPSQPRFLWEFSHADLGFSTCYPAIVRNGDRGDPGDWYVVFGSGPTNFDGGSSQPAKVFVLDLLSGNPVALHAVGGAPGFVGGVSTMDLERDYQVNAVYVAESYDDGAWQGKLHRLLVGNQAGGYRSPGIWSQSLLCSNRPSQPIVSTPNIAMYQPLGKPWVFWGTGRFFSQYDKTDTSTQSFYGVLDETVAEAGAAANLDPTVDLVDTSGFDILVGDPDNTVSGSGLGQVGLTAGDSWGDLEQAMLRLDTKKGWFFDVNEQNGDGERVLESCTVFGGLVLFTAFRPNEDICGFGGSGSLYGVHYATGTAAPGVSGFGIFSTSPTPPPAGTAMDRSLDMADGRPSSLSIHLGKEKGGKLFLQTSTGEIKEIEAELEDPTGSVVWYEQ